MQLLKPGDHRLALFWVLSLPSSHPNVIKPHSVPGPGLGVSGPEGDQSKFSPSKTTKAGGNKSELL